MLDEPLSKSDVKKLIHENIENDNVYFSGHAQKEMAKDKLSELDVVNVIRACIPQPGENEKGTWRYRICSNKICVVIAFHSETALAIVTAWRKEG